MRIISKLYLSFGLLLAIAVGGTSLAILCAREAGIRMERLNLAHQEYEGYLSLSNHTYQLFKQFGDAMLIGDRDRGRGESELLGKIRADIARIRRSTADSIRLVGEEEIEELENLERIESMIEELLVEHQNVMISRDREQFSSYWERLSYILDERIDTDFNQLIQEAIEGEAQEVATERVATAEMIRRFQLLAVIFTLMAIAAAAASIWILRRDLQEPIARLLSGASALARGDLEHRIRILGRNELHEVGHAFNKMAEEVASRERALSNANAHLESAVSERTRDLERLLGALKESDSNRKRLLADVSHELRTPLTIIRGEADIALRGDKQSAEPYRLALSNIRDAAMHTAGLVDDLLFVARREAGENRLRLELIDLADLLAKIVDQHRTISEQHHAQIDFTANVEKVEVRADAGRVRQVVLILLENAMRYGGSSIELRLDPAPGGYAIAVQDNGPGLTENEQSRVFERFFRGSNAAAHYQEGVGLGLPMAKAIVEAHGGAIALDSRPGDGLTVTFTLPKRGNLEVVA